MGRVFQSHQKGDRTASFYSKVVEVYTNFLEGWMESELGESHEERQEISAVEIEEAIEIIKHITEYRDKRAEDDAMSKVPVAEGRYGLGLLFIYTNEMAVAEDCLSSAFDAFCAAFGDDDARAVKCRKVLDRIDAQKAEAEED